MLSCDGLLLERLESNDVSELSIIEGFKDSNDGSLPIPSFSSLIGASSVVAWAEDRMVSPEEAVDDVLLPDVLLTVPSRVLASVSTSSRST
jgi:hypothetical protein